MKKVALVIIAVMMLLSFAGCSSDEIGMYGLSKEILKMNANALESSGIIKLSADGELLKGSSDKASKIASDLLKSGYEIKYTSKQKMKPLEFEMSLETRAAGETDFKKFTTVIFKDQAMYIKVDDLLTALKPYLIKEDPSSEKVLDNAISTIQYLKIDNMDKETIKVYDNNAEIMGLYTNFTDVVPEAFKDFTSAAVKKKDNGYVLSLNAQDSKKLIINFVDYFVKNIDTITGKFKEKINSLSEKDLSVFNTFGNGITIKKDDIIEGLDQIKESIKIVNPDYIKKQIEEDEGFNKGFKDIDGSKFEYFIGKNDDGSFNLTSNMKICYQDKLTIGFDSSYVIKSLDSFSAKIPENAFTVEQAASAVSPYLPETVTEVRTNIDSGETKIGYLNSKKSNDKLTVVVRDGRTYLPLRAVG
ncbi:MAG TPA: hypothetical protein VF941_03760, partial [Clostridia bacterium]